MRNYALIRKHSVQIDRWSGRIDRHTLKISLAMKIFIRILVFFSASERLSTGFWMKARLRNPITFFLIIAKISPNVFLKPLQRRKSTQIGWEPPTPSGPAWQQPKMQKRRNKHLMMGTRRWRPKALIKVEFVQLIAAPAAAPQLMQAATENWFMLTEQQWLN